MRFMLLMIPGVYQPHWPESERAGEDFTPPPEDMAEMLRFNEAMAEAGVLVDAEGLTPLQTGARVAFGDDGPVVTDGPFIETHEVLGGFWIIDVASKDEAVEWVRKCPAGPGDTIEIRPIFGEEEGCNVDL